MLQNVARILVPGRLEMDRQTAPGPPKGAPQVCFAHISNHAGVKVCTTVFLPHGCLALTRCAELLLRFGAKVDSRSEEEEETPLHVAARLGHVELADLLLRRGACPDARDAEGWTPLLAACDARCTSPADAEATTARCLQLCRLLLSAGADADAADQDRQRPLHLACRRGHADVVELLLSRGVGANAMDYGGHTALHCALQGPAAALAQSPERTVRALLNHGAVRVWPGALPKVPAGAGRRAPRAGWGCGETRPVCQLAVDAGSSGRGSVLRLSFVEKAQPSRAHTAHLQQEVGNDACAPAHMYIHCVLCIYTCLHVRECIRAWVMNVNRGRRGRTLKDLKRQEESGRMWAKRASFFLTGESG